MTSSARKSSKDAPVDVSIIVCTKDRGPELKEVLARLGRVRIPKGWRVELLMMDNGSTDDTKAIVETADLPNLEVRYVYAPEGGKVQAFNTGVAMSTGRALLMTDDDVHVPPDWIEGMCGPILSDKADAVQGGIRIAPHLERPWLTGVLRFWVASVEDPDHPPEGLVGANMACRRSALESIALPDVRLGPGAAGFFEDTVMGWELERAGYRKIFLPAVAVEHHFRLDRLTIRGFMASARRMAVARVIVDGDRDPPPPAPSVRALIPQLPGLAARSLTQLVRLVIARQPDAGFMARYYRLLLWQEQRRAAAARAQAAGSLRPAR
ncbi:glycosyltransferase family 2 protein [Phenylobacterium sp.]|uniref:glycosyltransferase n=1 Tax=Phenylobacterium sp. TaxID=1871053 RepID=UPI00356B6045